MPKYFVILLFLLPVMAFAAEQRIQSSVKKVTIFTDRAEVTREAQVTLAPGESEFLLTGIPQSIRPESLKASGSGPKGTSISGVELRQVPLAGDVSQKRAELTQRLSNLQAEMTTIRRRMESLNRQKAMLGALQLDSPQPENTEKIMRPRSPQEMAALLVFMNESEKVIEPELRSLDQNLEKLSKETSQVQAQLNQIQPEHSTETVLAVSVSAAEAGAGRLEISYQVGQANWRPSYNLKVVEDQKGTKFDLESYALISQRSGEDWSRVALTLSTARPHVGLVRPHPQPIPLDIMPPPMPLGKAKRAASPMAMNDAALEQNSIDFAAKEAPSEERVEMVEASAQINVGTVVTYSILGSISLPSDGSVEKVKVATIPLDGSLTNVVVPAIRSEVFREALLKTKSEAPLLPGEMGVFLNSEYVGSRQLPLTLTGAEFRTPIGASSSLTAERKLLKRFEDDSGIIQSVRRIRQEFKITLTNSSSTSQTVTVLEGLPVSRNEKITVTLKDVSPKPLEKGDKSRIRDEDGVFEWRADLAPNEKKEILYSAIVEYPASENVFGW